ncbi:UNVERIFIED_CONTAM: hypothetical protein HDU68_012892 [Siphonaria sp. JEL0065]|nr:hypothetical protein HDU68_012892 [Siphonaria sp. JEL0065]
MRSDEDVGKINAATPLLVSSALEQFLKGLVSSCVTEVRNRGGKKVMASHLKAAVTNNEKYDFLKDIVANVPDPVDAPPEDDEPKKKRKRGPPRKKGKEVKEEGGTGARDDEDNVKEEELEEDQPDAKSRKPSISNLLNDEDTD